MKERYVYIIKTKKSPEDGNIPVELIKQGSNKLYEHNKLFQTCINIGDITGEWKLSFLTTILKKDANQIYDDKAKRKYVCLSEQYNCLLSVSRKIKSYWLKTMATWNT